MSKATQRTERTLFLILGFVLVGISRFSFKAADNLFETPGASEGMALLLYFGGGWLSWAIGTGLWFYGFYLWTKLKGRDWHNMFWGLLSWVGVIIFALMKDKTRLVPKQNNGNGLYRRDDKEKEKISISRIPKEELIQGGYKYYCRGCGVAYEELSFHSLNGRVTTKMCSCGINSFATLDGDKPVLEDEE